MEIIIISEDGRKYTIKNGILPGNIWITRDDGESGDFDIESLGDAIFKTIDIFFEDNH